MVEREYIKVSRDAPGNQVHKLLKKPDALDVFLRTTFQGVCVVEFTDKLPQGLRDVFKSLDLKVDSISGQEPKLYRYYLSDLTENDVESVIVRWAEKEGRKMEQVSFSQDE